jgi:hypothetical protein
MCAHRPGEPSPPKAPWERLPAESPQAWHAFQLYRDIGAGKRSAQSMAQQLGKRMSLLERWNQQHQWQERIAAYDAEQERQLQVTTDREIQDAARRHAQNAAAAIGVLMLPIRALIRAMQAEPMLDAVLSAGVVSERGLNKRELEWLLNWCTRAAQMLPALVQVERLARGMSFRTRSHGHADKRLRPQPAIRPRDRRSGPCPRRTHVCTGRFDGESVGSVAGPLNCTVTLGRLLSTRCV